MTSNVNKVVGRQSTFVAPANCTSRVRPSVSTCLLKGVALLRQQLPHSCRQHICEPHTTAAGVAGAASRMLQERPLDLLEYADLPPVQALGGVCCSRQQVSQQHGS